LAKENKEALTGKISEIVLSAPVKVCPKQQIFTRKPAHTNTKLLVFKTTINQDNSPTHHHHDDTGEIGETGGSFLALITSHACLPKQHPLLDCFLPCLCLLFS
jgi:hypothetical protein